MQQSYLKLLDNNKVWVKEKIAKNPDYFLKLSQLQAPDYLWIGCSDSRVPANEITGTEPGEVFVHRNIANMVVHTDMNMLSVLDYAVNVLQVKHVIVCGHYGCGGVLAAMGNQQFGLIDNWLRHIKDGYDKHRVELDAIADKTERANRFVEFSVMEQVHHLSQTSIIQNSWKNHKRPSIHGWVYDLKTGIIKDLNVLMDGMEDVSGVYKFEDKKS
ncbi:MAG: carbonate dehydratase [Bacteroidia bacterium]